MPKFPQLHQQHRFAAGSHLNWLDDRQQCEPSLTSVLEKLAKHPGLHTGNVTQQNNALAMLQIFSLLSAVHTSPLQATIAAAKTDGEPFTVPFSVVENMSRLNVPEHESTAFNAALGSVASVLHHAGDYLRQHDPLTFPTAEAAEQPHNQFVGKQGDDQIIVEDIHRTIVDLSRDYYQVMNQQNPSEFMTDGEKTLLEFYQKYNDKYPRLDKLAHNTMKEGIQKRFHLNINPDDYNFMHFNHLYYEGRHKIHYGPPAIKRTLTECLFSNFGTNIQNNMQDMDAMCGIYPKTMEHNKEFDAAHALNIKPTDFINLVWETDFYKRAKGAIKTFFADKDKHTKKLFLDFINHLNTAKLSKEAAKDVLSGAGIVDDEKVDARLFDISGYRAANAVVFENVKNGRFTLYLPHSNFKFKSFDNDTQMRLWVTNSCADANFRKMLEKHFSLDNRRDGAFFSGVDSWLDSINQHHTYYDKIARKPLPLYSSDLFSTLVDKTEDKALADADTLIKSDAEVTRDMWEEAIDASNILLAPFSLFFSLGAHIAHLFNADTYQEEVDEVKKLGMDMVNIVTVVAIGKVLADPALEGYEFIESVKEGIETETRRDLVKFSEINELSPAAEENFNPASPSWNWLFDEPAPNQPVAYHRPLQQFLPLRETPIERDIVAFELSLNQYVTDKLRHYPWDIYYGFTDEPEYVPQYIRNARSTSFMHVERAVDKIRAAYDNMFRLANYWQLRDYFSRALGTEDVNIIDQSMSRFSMQLERARNFMQESRERGYNNFGIVSTRQIPSAQDEFKFYSAIQDMEHLRKLPKCFTAKSDPYRRIFIMYDAYPEIDWDGTDLFGQQKNNMDVALVHEASHAAGSTHDLYYNEVNPFIFEYRDSQELLAYFNRLLASGELKNSPDFKTFMNNAYQHLRMANPGDDEHALNMLRTDPMLRSNMIMDNADTFCIMVKELAELANNNRARRAVASKKVTDTERLLAMIFTASRDHIVLPADAHT